MKQFRSFCLLATILYGSAGYAAEPLHRRIDGLIAQQQTGQASRRTSDADFLRRVYLDFIGCWATMNMQRGWPVR